MDSTNSSIEEIYVSTDCNCDELYNIREDFINKYGPDVLRTLQKKQLAERLFAAKEIAHEIGFLGMFSWLEFSDSDNGIKKGTFGGVAAAKQYGLKLSNDGYYDYRTKEKKQISEEQAEEIAEEVRDVILSVCDKLQSETFDTQGDYERLSNEISLICSSKKSKCYWTFNNKPYSILLKYFHILFPNKIAEYYNDVFLNRAAKLLCVKLPDESKLVKNGVIMLQMKKLIPDADSIRFAIALNIYEKQFDYYKREQEFKKYLGNIDSITSKTAEGYIRGLKKQWWKYGVKGSNSPFEIGESAVFADCNKNVQHERVDGDVKRGFQLYYEFLSEAGNEINNADPKEVKINMGSKNIILYGPPGTGKTYNTVCKAVEIIEGENWAGKDYKDVKNEYDKLLSEGRINFITFHQSYGYEEFIEGIKPSTDGENIIYNVEPGVFLKFCDSARAIVGNTVDYGFNLSPTIWKVSLEGTGDNKTRAYCFDNDCIRVGFDSYGENIFDDTDFKDGGKIVLNAFINDMRIGDIVLSCYTNTTIDGIGVVTGDYEWHDEFNRFKRLRKVKWIFKGKKDIVAINGNKTMTLSTVYRLNNVTLTDVLKIVEGADYKIKNTSAKTSVEKGKYVFIIDEINRGNISKIFGELITLIEDNKREGASEAMSVKLPYSQKSFSVPDNVYIIGTMNTADRSITAIDTALRRRFTFEEMMPDYNALKYADDRDIIIDGVNIAKMLTKINERIAVLYDREHTIGHAYFMPLKDNPLFELLADIFRNKIIPLLQEYFYEDYGKICFVLGDNQKRNADFRFIKSNEISYSDLFGSTDDDLGERNKSYSINEEAFDEPQAYIGVYAPING